MTSDIRKTINLLESVNSSLLSESAYDQIAMLMGNIPGYPTFRCILQRIHSIDPEVWQDNKFKKFAIKQLLDKMTDSIEPARHRFPAFLYAADIFFHLKKHHCPWPELNIIEQHLDNFFKNYKFEYDIFDRYSGKFGKPVSYHTGFSDMLELWQEHGFSKMMEMLKDELYESQINEALPMGFFKTLATGAAAIFSDVALGKLDTGRAANRIYNNYMTYLGRIGKTRNTGTVGDLYSFLAKTGSNQKAMMAGLRTGTGLMINNENDAKKYWNTIIKDTNKISKSILAYAQNAAQLPEKDREPVDFSRQAQQGAASVDRIERAQARTTAQQTAQPQPTAPANDIETAIKSVLSKQDTRKQTASIDAALKALGG